MLDISYVLVPYHSLHLNIHPNIHPHVLVHVCFCMYVCMCGCVCCTCVGVCMWSNSPKLCTTSLCKKGCYTHLYNIVIQVVIQYLLYTLRIIVYNCV